MWSTCFFSIFLSFLFGVEQEWGPNATLHARQPHGSTHSTYLTTPSHLHHFHLSQCRVQSNFNFRLQEILMSTPEPTSKQKKKLNNSKSIQALRSKINSLSGHSVEVLCRLSSPQTQKQSQNTSIFLRHCSLVCCGAC